MTERELTFGDLSRAAEARDPELAELVIAYLAQPDPPEGQPEDAEEAPGAEPEAKPVPRDAWTLRRLERALSPRALANKTATEKKAARREAWDALLASEYAPPRLKVAQLILQLYQAGDEPARAALVQIFLRARIGFGLWQAMKRISKLAEAKHDLAIFGALAYRFDAARAKNGGEVSAEISIGTFIYLARRAWRYLRGLGRAVPELYPAFAAEVLRHYPEGFRFRNSWVANQIWAHRELIGRGRPGGIQGPARDLAKRAFDEAWKLSPDPLLYLLEEAKNETVADFAIKSLRKDHADALRNVDPRWLARIGKKPLGAVHDFILELMNESPELHPSKLRALGLHEMVLSLLGSPSAAARKYAIDYARAHAQDLSVAELARWVRTSDAAEVRAFAASRLAEKSAAELGLEILALLLDVRETAAMAAAKIKERYTPRDLTEELFTLLFTAGQSQRKLLTELYDTVKQRPPAAYYRAVLRDPRTDDRAFDAATRALAAYPGKEIGAEWVKSALFDPKTSSFAEQLLRGGAFRGEELGVDWLFALVQKPRLRALAIELMGNTKLVAPRALGVERLLELARHADESLSQFAHRYLLQHLSPADFDPSGAGDAARGIDRLWSLVSGPGEPEVVRRFAASYLELHHPDLGPTRAEARSLGITEHLPPAAYAEARVAPLFDDARADVRRFAAAVTAEELVRWNDRALLYKLADHPSREARGVASEALLAIGEADADPRRVPPIDWLDSAAVFSLAESAEKAARELALALIRRHYARLGSASRLAWLMESPDREVRLFAVRLLFEKHRPRPDSGSRLVKAEPPVDASRSRLDAKPERFDAGAALQQFLRTTLFGLPPGRMERRELSKELLPDRALPASVAKRRLIEVVRDLAVEDAEAAKLVAPILGELAHSTAKGEWQSSVAALARIAKAHPSLQIQYGRTAT